MKNTYMLANRLIACITIHLHHRIVDKDNAPVEVGDRDGVMDASNGVCEHAHFFLYLLSLGDVLNDSGQSDRLPQIVMNR